MRSARLARLKAAQAASAMDIGPARDGRLHFFSSQDRLSVTVVPGCLLLVPVGMKRPVPASRSMRPGMTFFTRTDFNRSRLRFFKPMADGPSLASGGNFHTTFVNLHRHKLYRSRFRLRWLLSWRSRRLDWSCCLVVHGRIVSSCLLGWLRIGHKCDKEGYNGD